ncbi:MAG: MAPEG family protein [Rhodobacteraceae bacterium]|nr:MAPEG family protein [Paracoccaceae bacterium]
MDLPSKIILITVIVQVFFTLWTILSAGMGRANALKTTDLTLKDVALDNKAYPEEILKLGNNMQNQFETPVLLYAGAAIAMSVGANWVMAVAGVAYLTTRFWHRWIHIRHNRVGKRFMVFVYGIAALSIFWMALTAQVFML